MPASRLSAQLVNQWTNNLGHPIGQGGFGEVFLGVDRLSGREYAVKTLPLGLTEGKGADQELLGIARRALDRERAAQDRLPPHPNICRLLHYAPSGPNTYLVYPYLANGTLAEALRLNEAEPKEPVMDWRLRVAALAGVAKGLRCMHEHGLFHRDVKPQNVGLGEGMQAQLLDCGCAILADDKFDPSRTQLVTAALYGTHQAFVSDGFTDPDVVDNPISFSDANEVYSLGVVILTALTGLDGVTVNPDRLSHRSKLTALVRDFKDEDRIGELLDRRPGTGDWPEAVSDALWLLAFECVGSRKRRPKLREVMHRLAELSRGSPPGWDPFYTEAAGLRRAAESGHASSQPGAQRMSSSGPQLQYTCSICLDDELVASDGVLCKARNNDRHFLCKGCFSDYVANQSQPANARTLREQGHRIYCCAAPNCEARHPAADLAFTPRELALFCTDESYGQYLRVREQGAAAEAEAQERTRAEVLLFRQRLDFKLQERAGWAKRETEGAVQQAYQLVVEEGLNMRCPGCKAVFLDYDGCAAVTCTCGKQFCGLCLAGPFADAHPHVQSCPKHAVKDTVFVPEIQIRPAWKSTRIDLIKAVFQRNSTKPAVAWTALQRANRELADVGIRPDDVMARPPDARGGADMSQQVEAELVAEALKAGNWTEALHNSKLDGFKLQQLAPKLEDWRAEAALTLLNAIKSGEMELVRLLIGTNAADLDAQHLMPGGQYTVLMLAAEANNIELLDVLLEAGAGPNVGNSQGLKPIHLACKNGHKAIVRSLLDHADPDAPNSNGQRPLHLAVAHGHVEVVRALLEPPGVDVGARDKAGATAWFVTKAVGVKQEDFEACRELIKGETLLLEAKSAARAMKEGKYEEAVRHCDTFDFDYALFREELGSWKLGALSLLSPRLIDTVESLNLVSCLVKAGILKDRKTTAAGEAPDTSADSEDLLLFPLLLQAMEGTLAVCQKYASDSSRSVQAEAAPEPVARPGPGAFEGQILSHADSVSSVFFHPSPNLPHIVATGGGKNVQLWDWRVGREFITIKGYTDVRSVSFHPSPDLSYVVALRPVSKDKAVVIWDWKDGKELKKLEGHTKSVTSASFHAAPDLAHVIATGSQDKTVRVWDWRQGKELKRLESTDAVSLVRFHPSPDQSHFIATLSGTNVVQVWDWMVGKELTKLKGLESSSVCSVSFHPSPALSHIIATGSGDNTVRIWDWKEGKELKKLEGHTKSVTSICFHPSPDHTNVLASGSTDKSIRVWDWKEKKELKKLEDHTQAVLSVSFHPSPALPHIIASGSDDKTVRLWDWR